MDESRYGGLIDKYWILQVIVIPLIIIISLIGIVYFFMSNLYSTEDFKKSCESYGGTFYELQNTSCKIGHENCIFTCELNGNIYDLDEVGAFGISKYFCIEDCNYENKLSKNSCFC
jgi:hypothetical protein